MRQPLVSVVIPSYNRAQYITETIDSVLAQTYSNVEIIVVDDGSTDNTREVVERYLPRVQYVWQVNSERGASRNHGLRLSKGKYIAFLDSDDLWLPNKINDDLQLFDRNPGVGIVYSDIDQVDATGKFLRTIKRRGHTGKVTDKLLRDNFVSVGAHLLRTDLAEKLEGFREERELSGSEDWEFWVRLSTVTDFAYLSKATTRIRTHPENTMNNAAAMNRSMNAALSIMQFSDYLTREEKKRLAGTKSMISLINAINYCSAGDKRSVINSLKQSFLTDPRILGDLRFGYTIWRLLVAKATRSE